VANEIWAKLSGGSSNDAGGASRSEGIVQHVFFFDVFLLFLQFQKIFWLFAPCSSAGVLWLSDALVKPVI
jgi:hypothetical protein